MKLVLKKTASLIITLFIVSLLAFLAFQIIPGDPTTKILGTNASAQKAEALREQLGLNRPVTERYLDWLVSFLQGDFGTSYSYLRPVSSMLADKLPVTALLTLLSFALTALLSIPLGIASGSMRSQAADHLAVITDQIIMAIPPFFFGIISCYVFGVVLKWFLPGNYIPPSDSAAGCTVRMLRGSIRDELTENYVLTAKSRGLSRREILLRHVLRNAMIPVVTFLAVSAAEIMTGTIIIEQVFTIPGIGRLLVSSIGNRDYPVVQAIVVLLAAWIMIVNFLADLVNHWMDPRLRS